MGQNLQNWLLLQGASLTMFVFSTVALMMLGLGLFKAGVFSGRAPNGVYVALIAVGGAVLTGGSAAGTIGGAVVGGVIGHEIKK